MIISAFCLCVIVWISLTISQFFLFVFLFRPQQLTEMLYVMQGLGAA